MFKAWSLRSIVADAEANLFGIFPILLKALCAMTNAEILITGIAIQAVTAVSLHLLFHLRASVAPAIGAFVVNTTSTPLHPSRRAFMFSPRISNPLCVSNCVLL